MFCFAVKKLFRLLPLCGMRQCDESHSYNDRVRDIFLFYLDFPLKVSIGQSELEKAQLHDAYANSIIKEHVFSA